MRNRRQLRSILKAHAMRASTRVTPAARLAATGGVAPNPRPDAFMSPNKGEKRRSPTHPPVNHDGFIRHRTAVKSLNVPLKACVLQKLSICAIDYFM